MNNGGADDCFIISSAFNELCRLRKATEKKRIEAVGFPAL